MSAIFGLVSTAGRPAGRAEMERIRNVLAPFGADRQTIHVEGALAFGHCLGRITPDDDFECQPVHGGGGRYVLVADARIYNRDELIKELAPVADGPRSISDSALLMSAWERWQAAALARIEGDYAFALWDRETRTLHMARDPAGHRALVWYQGADFLAFATLPKALFALPEVPRELDRGRVADELALLPWVGEETLFRAVRRVIPGHRLEYDGRHTRQLPMRRLDPDQRIVLRSDGEYLEAFGEHLERAVSERLRSRGGIATHLSAGYDSSTVTATAARLLARSGRRLSAYTAVPRPGFDGPVPKGRNGNEATAAAALARRYSNIDHILVSAGHLSPLDGLHEANEWMDWPVHQPALWPWMRQIDAEAKARGDSVLLTGLSGNFTISYHGMGLLPALIRSGRWWRWWREAHALHRAGSGWKGMLASSFGPYAPASLWGWLKKGRHGMDSSVYGHSAIHPEFAAAIELERRAHAAHGDLARRPPTDMRRLRARMFDIPQRGGIFVAPLQHGIEWRDPSGDFRLAQFCLAIPDDQYLRDGQTRWLLKRLMADVLPPEILQQQGGRGLQSADWYEGLETARTAIGEWIEQLQETPSAREMLDLERLREVVESWPEGGWDHPGVVRTYQYMLLRGLSVGSFIQYVEGRGNR